MSDLRRIIPGSDIEFVDDPVRKTLAVKVQDNRFARATREGIFSIVGGISAGDLTGELEAQLNTAYSEALAAKDATDGFVEALGVVASDAAADVRSYAYSKADVDSSVALSASNLTTAFSAADSTVATNAQTYTQTYAYSKSTVDTALSSLSTSLSANFSAADAETLASANSYTYSKSTIDAALSSTFSTLTANFSAADAFTLATANAFTYSRASIDGAISGAISTLSATLNGSISAAVTEERVARVSETGVLNSQWALKTVATRADGKVVLGTIGLASTSNSSGSQSQIILQSDSIVFVPGSDPNASPATFLTFGYVGGVPTLVVPAARIGDLSIGTPAIAQQAATTEKLANNAAGLTIPADAVNVHNVQAMVVITAADIPAGQSTVQVTVQGGWHQGAAYAFGIGRNSTGVFNSVVANLFFANPGSSGVFTFTKVDNVPPGTYYYRAGFCYATGEFTDDFTSYDGNAKNLSLIVQVKKKS